MRGSMARITRTAEYMCTALMNQVHAGRRTRRSLKDRLKLTLFCHILHGSSRNAEYFRLLAGTDRLVVPQRASNRRRRATWVGTEIGNEARVMKAKAAEAKAAGDETRDTTGSEAVASGTARTLLEKG
jgi:hypothetical protein